MEAGSLDSRTWMIFGDMPGEVEKECAVVIPLHSSGIASQHGIHILEFSLTRLLLQLALIFIVSQSLHMFFKRFNFSRSFSEILAGFVLGKAGLGKLLPAVVETVYPEGADVFLSILSKIGLSFFMFLVGVKMDPSSISKAGAKGLTIAICVSAIPTAITAYTSNNIVDIWFPVYRRPNLKSVITFQNVIAFPVVAMLLIDLKIMNSELGRIALASSLLGNLISLSYGTVLSLWRLRTIGLIPSVLIQATFLQFLSTLGLVVFIRKLSTWTIQQTPEGKPVKSSIIVFIALFALIGTIISDNVGFEYLTIPLILGIVVPDGPPLGSTLVEKLDTIISGMFAPLVMTTLALRVDPWTFRDLDFIWILWKGILGTFAAKFISAFIGAILCQVPVRDAAALAAILNIKGIVEVSMLNVVYANERVDDDTLSTLMMSVLLVQAFVAVFVKLTYDQSSTYRCYQKRNILHAPSNTELRVLACTHRQDDVLSAIKLLEISAPGKDNPILAYALNLMELVGRATPLLINHGYGQKGASVGNRSQQMIDAFQNMENRCTGLISYQAFTSVSLPKFMHHDICSLAFDKCCSLIILPFHKKWNHQGQVIFDSNIIRTINRNVIDMSPCSVGVLVDRRKIRHDASADPTTGMYNVGVVFMGGDDDREALAYGKRLARSSGIHLTVVRLVAADNTGENQWDAVFDTETLKEVKVQSAIRDNIVYREEVVKDGPETALIINAMEEAFDMIVVGRRHREDSPLLTGITEWSEFPELGAIGDILASSEISKPVSVLILQQQIIKNR